MTKVIEWDVICPHCDHEQTYHSHNKTVDSTRQKTCNRCGKTFNAKKHCKSKIPAGRRKEKEKKEKPKGFFKYSKS